MDCTSYCTGISCCGKPPAKKIKTESEVKQLIAVAHCLDNFIQEENDFLVARNASLENQLARALRQVNEFTRSINTLRRAANGALARSNELQTMLEVQIDANDQLHAYCQRIELRLQQYEPDFEPEFEVIDLTADSEVDSDATVLEEEELDRDM